MNQLLKIVTVIPALVDLGQLIANRVRARRAARKAGKQGPPMDPANVKRAQDDLDNLIKAAKARRN